MRTQIRRRRSRWCRPSTGKDSFSNLPTSPKTSDTCAHDPFRIRSKPNAKSRGLYAAREGYILEDCIVNCGVTADRVVRFASDHQKLTVGSSGFARRVVYFVERKSLCEPQID